MKDITIDFFEENPEDNRCDIMIEGLPGVGQVGKLVAEHLIEELGAEKVAEIQSVFFPPQVIIDETGVAHMPNNEIFRYSGEGVSILFLTGDFQSSSSEGHYLMTDAYLDVAEKYGVKRIYTLGGYGVGHLIDEIRVLAAVNGETLRDEVEKAGAIFAKEEPGGGIIGASGLLLGLGARKGIEGICLMGETSGYLVDPKSSSSVLEVLSKLTGIEVDPTKLVERADEMEVFVERLKAMDQQKSDEELSYIG
ncbi:proteasome assembly chaperone family protein [Methanoplanus endosymbiosus]|uniref:Proteasome assembly chaperone family protein n=1 Tax=Methanoplanus endosymbiosus TaxID=33865 RepID=A0A9E7PP04_9EURY|nr:proteasome assembly chaperone family protein [Methanoplanus endosymbiosus]UUX92822.1 proteasome assembly chaperone family protein [Methanoplanus endosymbiosus]